MSRAEKRNQTRAQLLDAAERLFAEKGFLAVSVDEIAQQAGYTRGAVYGNFEGREGIFLAVLHREAGSQRWAELVDQPSVDRFLRALTDQIALLRGMVRAHVEFTALAAGKPELLQQLRRHDAISHAEFDSAAETIFRSVGLGPQHARRRARLLRALVNGILLETVSEPDLDVRPLVRDAFGALSQPPAS